MAEDQVSKTHVGPSAGKDYGSLQPGVMIGRYEIVSVLGQGGFGITYQARDTQLDRDVAIKEYLPSSLAVRHEGSTVVPRSTEMADDFVWGRARFLDEAKTMARFADAPAVVRVHEFLEANGTAYVVMPLLKGETLAARLKREGRLQQPAIERILYPLLDGLEQVHAAGFLHRDIKPANIILAADGSPTLIDFGASRAAMQGRSQAMTAVFTPGFAPVEQFTSGKQGPWTDIYALAATLYACISGKPPPNALDRMIDESIVPAAEIGKRRYAPSLLAAIDAGLTVKVDDRPQTIDQWREVLATGSMGRSADAMATVAMTAASSPRRGEAPASVQAVSAGGRKRAGRWAAAAAAVVVLAGGGYGIFVATRPPTVSTVAQSMTVDQLARAMEERRKADMLSDEKKKLEEEAQRRADADADAKRKADEALLAAQQQRQKAEQELTKLKAEMETRQQAEAVQREQAAAAAQRAVEEAAKRNEAEAAMAALRKTEAEAKEKAAADATAQQRADQAAQRKVEAEAAALRKVEEEAQKKVAAEAEAKRLDDEALAKAQAERQRADEEAAKQKMEAQAKARSAAEADAKAKADALAAADKKAAEAAEAGLRLTQTDRQRLQIALTSLGFSTNGSDGVFGPRSREMIAGWQKARNLPVTGFLVATQQQALLREADAAVSKYDDEQKKFEEDKKKAEEQKKRDEEKKKADDAKAAAAGPPASPSVTTTPATPQVATTPAQLAPTSSQGSADGVWQGSYVCGPGAYEGVSGGNFSHQFSMTISNGRGKISDFGGGSSDSGGGVFEIDIKGETALVSRTYVRGVAGPMKNFSTSKLNGAFAGNVISANGKEYGSERICVLSMTRK